MYHDLTKGGIAKSLILFSLPMTAGNLLQQLYNIADTLIVGRALGRDALAAVGSAYTLMTFMTSVFIGLAMGSGALFSIYIGKDDREKLKDSVWQSFVLIVCRDSGNQHRCVYLHRPDTSLSEGAGRAVFRYAGIPCHNLRRNRGDLSL